MKTCPWKLRVAWLVICLASQVTVPAIEFKIDDKANLFLQKPFLKKTLDGAQKLLNTDKSKTFIEENFYQPPAKDTSPRLDIGAVGYDQNGTRVEGSYDESVNIIHLDPILVDMAEKGDQKAREALENTLGHEFMHWLDKMDNETRDGGRNHSTEIGLGMEKANGIQWNHYIYNDTTGWYANPGWPGPGHPRAPEVPFASPLDFGLVAGLVCLLARCRRTQATAGATAQPS